MADITEAEVVKLWQRLLFEPGLTAEEGQAIQIIYPGRPNDDRGGDFCNAVIRAGRQLSRGNIEVHVRSGDWQAHNHHLDPAYNQVVLHVAMWAKHGAVTTLPDGKTVPTLVLHTYLKTQGQGKLLACANALERLSPPSLGARLDAAGQARFRVKAAGFRRMLREKGAGQCLYEGIMTALGYSKNRQPFQRLAELLPLESLETPGLRTVPDEDYLAYQQALLLGSGGLLPGERSVCHEDMLSPGWVARLEAIWASYRRKQSLSATDWHLCKVRPGNSPVRRLVAMSYVLLRCREPGLLVGLSGLVTRAPAQGAHQLAAGLVVAADGYWAGHIDCNMASRGPAPAPLGAGRAGDIVVNILLPFAWARGQSEGQQVVLGQKALELYGSYPRLAENAIERHMKRQLKLDNRLVNTARRQQGLLHIYHTLCTQGKCAVCGLA